MNKFLSALQKLAQPVASGLRSFMTGRYGVDQLNLAILIVGLLSSIAASFLRGSWVGFALVLVSYGFMFLAIFRALSRNTYRRYQENRRFLHWKEGITDRKNRYYACPQCRQMVRVPRGKGKIAITCPKCREKFTRKT